MKIVGIFLLLCGSCFALPPNDSKIVGGSKIDIREVPYQVSIRLRLPYSGNPFHICGGAIISSRSILTAAHCKFVVPNLLMLLHIEYEFVNRYKEC